MTQKFPKQQRFLHGAMILAISTALVKIIGFIFTIPLVNMLGAEGMGYFYTAYEIYGLFTVVVTAGLPVAVAKMISEAATKNNTKLVNAIFRISKFIFYTFGFVCAVAMVFCAGNLADLLKNPNSKLAIQALGPMVFFQAILAAYRGYFQGKSNMIPTAVIQIIEAALKLLFGVGIAYALLKIGYSNVYAAAGAIAGVSIGSIVAVVYALIYKKKEDKYSRKQIGLATSIENKELSKRLINIAIPITLGTIIFNIIGVIDTAIIMRRLQDAVGLSYFESNWLYGVYGNAKKLFNFPVAFIIPFASSIIPALSAAITRKDQQSTQGLTLQSLKVTSLLAFPSGAGLFVLAYPIMNLIYFKSSAEIAVGAQLLSVLGIAVIFSSIVLITNSIIQVSYDVKYPAITMTIGGVVKIVSCWIFVGDQNIGIIGAPISTCICYAVTAILNIILVSRKLISFRASITMFLKILVCTVIMAIAAYNLNGLFAIALSEKIACILAMGISAIIYIILAVCTRLVTREDIKQLPKGEKIADIFHIK